MAITDMRVWLLLQSCVWPLRPVAVAVCGRFGCNPLTRDIRVNACAEVFRQWQCYHAQQQWLISLWQRQGQRDLTNCDYNLANESREKTINASHLSSEFHYACTNGLARPLKGIGLSSSKVS